MKKGPDLKVDDGELCAVNQLKRALTSDSVLKLYYSMADTEIHADASNYGYGAVLLQRDSEDLMFHPA